MNELKCVRSGASSSHYHLQGEDGRLGSLTWLGEARGVALAEVGNKVFVFRKAGVLRPYILVETVSETPVARINVGRSDSAGHLRLSDGRTFEFITDEFLEWRNDENRTLVRIEGNGADDAPHIPAAYERESEDIPLLLLVAGLYILKSRKQQG